MPKPCQYHGRQEVQRGFPFPARTATQRDVQVIAKPGAQTDVPAPPEILESVRQERLPEIDHEMESHQLSAASRDIAIAAEISVHLPRERIRSDQHNPQGWLSELADKSCLRQPSAIVRDHALAQEPGKNQHQTVEEPVRIEGAVPLDLRKQVPRSLNRACDQMREQAYE